VIGRSYPNLQWLSRMQCVSLPLSGERPAGFRSFERESHAQFEENPRRSRPAAVAHASFRCSYCSIGYDRKFSARSTPTAEAAPNPKSVQMYKTLLALMGFLVLLTGLAYGLIAVAGVRAIFTRRLTKRTRSLIGRAAVQDGIWLVALGSSLAAIAFAQSIFIARLWLKR
jgi:hypothetical protein